MQKSVIYHSADFDGIFCREIAKRFLLEESGEDEITYHGWNFGEPQIVVPEDNLVYILDLPPEALENVENRRKLFWIDHHKTSIDKWGERFPGFQLDGVAACRLAWQFFTCPQGLATKEGFVDRFVDEPWAVRLAGEYDIWDKRDPDAELFQYGLRSEEINWPQIFKDEAYVKKLLIQGKSLQYYVQTQDASLCKSRTWLQNWEGLNFLCVNTARFNSLFFAAKDIPATGHDALLGFIFTGKTWMVSLYHAAHRKDLDLSEIAKRHGGGGHRGACGFTCATLPFPLSTHVA